VGERHGDHVDVASAAGRYNPLFYAVVGYPSLPFSGSNALVAMRVGGAVACWLLFVLALLCVKNWATSAVPYVCLAIAMTPGVVYATAIAAPNGLEIAAGLAWWAALIGLGVAERPHHDRRYLFVAAIAGSVLVTVRSLGPLWCVLTLATCLVALPLRWERVREIVGRPAGIAAVAAVALSSLASLFWILGQAPLDLGSNPSGSDDLALQDGLAAISTNLVVWPLQAVGTAFPQRNQPAPMVAYVGFVVLVLALLVMSLRVASGRMRWAIALGVATLFVLPSVITLLTIDDFGKAWQGRYELPYGVGILLLAGMAWQRAKRPPGWRLLIPGFALFALAHAATLLTVLGHEMAQNPAAATAAWHAPAAGTAGLVMVLGVALLWFGAGIASGEGGDRERASRAQYRHPVRS
jgi:hypothetical protein